MNRFGKAFCEAIGQDPDQVLGLVIDVNGDETEVWVRLAVSQHDLDGLAEVDWLPTLGGAIVGVHPEPTIQLQEV